MKIAVVGSRNFKDAYIRVQKCLLKQKRLYGDRIIIVTGGGGVVDHAAITISIELGLRLLVIPANWQKYGTRAGPKRNREIAKYVDVVFAFWDGKSAGTASTIRYAEEFHKKVVIRREEKR